MYPQRMHTGKNPQENSQAPNLWASLKDDPKDYLAWRGRPLQTVQKGVSSLGHNLYNSPGELQPRQGPHHRNQCTTTRPIRHPKYHTQPILKMANGLPLFSYEVGKARLRDWKLEAISLQQASALQPPP